MFSTLKVSLSVATILEDGVIRRDNEVKAARDQMDLGIYGCGSLDDLVDPGMRATDHQHKLHLAY